MCWPVKSQLWALWYPTQTGYFSLKLNTPGYMPCFAAGNQRMFDRWAWRLMAVCVCLMYSPSKAVAKVNKSKPLFRPPSETSLRDSCYHLAEKNHWHSSSRNVCRTCEIAITHILWLWLHLQFLPLPSVNRLVRCTDQVEVMTSEYCFVVLNFSTLWLFCLICFGFNEESVYFQE